MTIMAEQRAAILDGLRAAVKPSGGVINEMVLDGILALADVDDPVGLAKLRQLEEALQNMKGRNV